MGRGAPWLAPGGLIDPVRWFDAIEERVLTDLALSRRGPGPRSRAAALGESIIPGAFLNSNRDDPCRQQSLWHGYAKLKTTNPFFALKDENGRQHTALLGLRRLPVTGRRGHLGSRQAKPHPRDSSKQSPAPSKLNTKRLVTAY